MSTRDAWLRPKLEARLWWCGDDVCDCHEPQIDKIEPNIEAGYPWIKRQPVWRGTFEGEGQGIQGMLAELAAAAQENGIALDEDHYGTKDLT